MDPLLLMVVMVPFALATPLLGAAIGGYLHRRFGPQR
jgi:hypothetical protein